MFSISFLSSLPLSLLALRAYAAPIQERSSNGPVISSNFMDPSVIEISGSYYAFGGANGNPAGINVQVATSSDFNTWTLQSGHDALPTLPSWSATPGHVWAPDINQLSDGTFVLYYTTATAQSPGMHCVGAATASTIQGPYTPLDEPFACDLAAGGSIDPDGFRDPVSGNRYVVYKVDGNSIGHGGACSNSVAPIVPTPILLQQVASDGTTQIGGAIQLITNDAVDGSSVEAPTIAYSSTYKTYYLLYSSGCYVDTSYSIRVATATSVTGPWTKSPQPFLVTGQTAADVYIPGGADASQDGTKFVFHGDLNLGWFQSPPVGLRTRGMFAAQLEEFASSAFVGTLY